MSTRPKVSAARRCISSTVLSSPAVPMTTRVLAPRAWASCSTPRASASLVRLLMITLAPRAANSRMMARPMFRPEPVTSIVLPVKSRSLSIAMTAPLPHGLDQIEMGRPASPLAGPSPSRNDLGIDGHLVKHGDQGDGGEFVEQVIGQLSRHALAGLGVQGLGELGVLLLYERALKEMRQGVAGVGRTDHFFGGPQANDIGPDAAGRVLGSRPARQEDRVSVLYSGRNPPGF